MTLTKFIFRVKLKDNKEYYLTSDISFNDLFSEAGLFSHHQLLYCLEVCLNIPDVLSLQVQPIHITKKDKVVKNAKNN